MYHCSETMSTIIAPDELGDSSDDGERRSSFPYSVVTSLRFLGFWGAVVLPFLYIPLFISGLDTAGQQQTFILLLVLNVVALVFGHRYRT